VRRGDQVVRLQREAGARRARLLADGQVHGAVHEPTGEELVDRLLEPAGRPHRLQRLPGYLGFFRQIAHKHSSRKRNYVRVHHDCDNI
jgi:hypothetical protein